MEKEKWAPMRGFEGLYEISNFGRVKSLPKRGGSKEPRIMAINKSRDYSHVTLCIDRHVVCKDIHRLVAEAFVENPHNKPCVNHKDGNKRNNRSTNLEWVTVRENNIHSYHVIGRKKYTKRKPVKCVETEEIFDSITSAAKSERVVTSTIARAIIRGNDVHGKHWVALA